MGGSGGLAEEVRVGLEVLQGKPQVADKPKNTSDKLERIFHRKTVRRHILEFAQVFAVIFVGYSIYDLTFGSKSLAVTFSMLILSLILILLAKYFPLLIHPVWDAWIALGEGLGMVTSFLILSLTWIAMVIPMGLILRILGRKVMDTNFKEEKESYWLDKNPKDGDFKLLERQY